MEIIARVRSSDSRHDVNVATNGDGKSLPIAGKPGGRSVVNGGEFLLLALALYFLVRYLRRVTPRPDHPLALRADAYTDKPTDAQMTAARVVWLERIFDRDLFEKVVLLSLLLIIFSNIIPTIDTAVRIRIAPRSARRGRPLRHLLPLRSCSLPPSSMRIRARHAGFGKRRSPPAIRPRSRPRPRRSRPGWATDPS